MKKYFVFGDAHSFYSILIDALKAKGFRLDDPEHIIISLGDNFDRGEESFEMLEFLLDMANKERAILIRGNHEDLIHEILSRGYSLPHDKYNKTIDTLYQLYARCDSSAKKDVNLQEIIYSVRKNSGFYRFLASTIDYYETDKYIFTHGFIPIEKASNHPIIKANWRDSPKVDWDNARWLNGMAMSIIYHLGIAGKHVVVGHKNCSYGNVRKDTTLDPLGSYRDKEYSLRNKAIHLPYTDDNVIGLDSCTVLTKKINVLVFEEDKL